MNTVIAFLCFALGAILPSSQVRLYDAKVTLTTTFPPQVSAPISVEILEPVGGTLAKDGETYVVQQSIAFSHATLRVTAPGFAPVVVNTATQRLFDWATSPQVSRLDVVFKAATVPELTVDRVRSPTAGRGLRIQVSNPFDRELIVTSLSLDGWSPKPGQPPNFTGSTFILKARVAGHKLE